MKGQIKKSILSLFLVVTLLFSNGMTYAQAAAGQNTNEGQETVEQTDTPDTKDVGIVYNGKVTYKGTTVGAFTVNGSLAFCMEHLKPTPPTGTPFHEQIYDNEDIRKVLYYGWGGKEQWSGFSSYEQGMVCTSLALSYYYSGADTIGMEPHGPKATELGLSDFFYYLDTQADPEVHTMKLSKSYTEAYLSPDKSYQMTEDITFQSSTKNTITIPLKSGMKLVNKTTGKTLTGNATVKGGDTFYLTAPLTMNETWSSGKLSGSMGKFNSVLAIMGNQSLQSLGYGQWAVDPDRTVELSVKWEAIAKVQLQKTDAETGKGTPQGGATLAGAKYQVFLAGTNTPAVDVNGNPIILTTNEKGLSEVSAYMTFGKYDVKEIAAPEGYVLNDTVYSIRLPEDADDNMVAHIKASDKVIRGDVQITKYGESNDETGDSDADIKQPLEGIQFHLTSKTTGKKYTIVTDENGIATTKDLLQEEQETVSGALPYDTYVVTEESPYEEYDPVAPFEIKISEDTKTYHYILRNDTVDAPISVQKLDATTGKVIPVAGAKFQILDKDKNVIEMTVTYPSNEKRDTWETDETGSFYLPQKLESGNYYLREVLAPEGYLLNDEDIPFVVDKESDWDTPVTVTCADNPAMGKIRITKTDKTTDKPIPTGATFEITAKEDIVTPDGTVRAQKGEVVDRITTGEDGTATSKELFLGKYIVKETQAPEGYLLNEKSFSVKLSYEDQNTEIVYGDVTVPDKPAMGKVRILKTDATTENAIPTGATFEITAKEDIVTPDGTIRAKAGEVVDTITTGEDGAATSKKLFLGNYVVKETQAPEGYLLNETAFDVTLAYADQNTKIVYADVTVSDKPAMGNIEIIKLDQNTSEKLPHATFEIRAEKDIVTPDGTIRAKAGEVVDTITTGEDGTATSKELFLGEYVVKEIQQPNGFLLSDQEYKVTLKYQDQLTPIVTETKEVTNQPTEVVIQKTDEDGEPLRGVTFHVWNKAMIPVDQTDADTDDVQDNMGEFTEEDLTDSGMSEAVAYTTDEKGEIHIQYLSPGTYCFQETKADGYIVDHTVYELTIAEDGRVNGEEVGVLEMANQPNKVTIQKVQAGSDEVLQGVEFQVWNKEMESDLDGEMSFKETYTTDENGKIQLSHLNPGQYCIQETKTLPGYVLDDQVQEFTVREDGRIVIGDAEPVEEAFITFENDYTKLYISKQDATTGKELPGAELELIHKESGETVAKWTSTDKPHYIEMIEAGEYILREKMAPDGYEVAEDVSFTVESTGEIQKVVMKDELKKVPEKSSDQDTVQTGDHTNSFFYLFVSVVSVAFVVFFLYWKKKRA